MNWVEHKPMWNFFSRSELPWNDVLRTAITPLMFYICLCSILFRFLYANHKKYFKGGKKENENKLSKYVCDLKRQNVDFRITLEVIKKAQSIADGNNSVCRLCLKKSTAVVYAFKKEGCLLRGVNSYRLVDIWKRSCSISEL